MEGWRKLHNEEPSNLYSSKYYCGGEMNEDGACSAHRENENAYKILVENPEGRP
jgi:hypothetical protein